MLAFLKMKGVSGGGGGREPLCDAAVKTPASGLVWRRMSAQNPSDNDDDVG